ncbi:hypothetical protein N7478_002521 [Penicillium angulare]|uniref:uncharacterized protein n=1 Tax=Penicillium angulare TaxID=116970 RepID=UPI002540D553|nr:uncharacterized protein N7478_002521 [Penicillium angulare]KAJ5286835.1 hypothetical protein N7478_002521 [Penicillium angulare]
MAATQNLNRVELGQVRDGYPALASWIGRDPDGETLVFRRFRRLSARNLLHLQSGLIQLEQEIDELDEEARKSSDLESRQASRRWETLIQLGADSTRLEKKRLEKAAELSSKMKEYEEALLRQSQISELSGPGDRVLSTYRDYIEGNAWKSAYLPSVPIISGNAKDMLKEADDLVSLKKVDDEDILSKFLQDHWVFQRHKGSDPLDQTTIYKGQHITRIVAAMSILFSAVLLVVAIISLYVIDNPTTKLGLVVAYTFIFALSIALLTSAKRAEIFGAAAAYAATVDGGKY